ncbi:MAG: ribose 5-phosphate isomerase B [Chlamydiae bacterium]|nr:ribose 5-phosphate isomerase B [Chlamydiota bacterium]MBI3267212.1 ribose 5-phosphate isomerase B [Chlamydiota bacterium]
MKIALGADHGGYKLKEEIKSKLEGLGHQVTDVGCFNEESVDYPDYGARASKKVSEGSSDRAILLCKTGIGMSIVANKIRGVRGALCMDEKMAKMSRLHNDANVLILPATYVKENQAMKIVDEWLKTDFEGGRHEKRVKKIKDIENH